jgi:hypothetical protein
MSPWLSEAEPHCHLSFQADGSGAEGTSSCLEEADCPSELTAWEPDLYWRASLPLMRYFLNYSSYLKFLNKKRPIQDRAHCKNFKG